MRTFLHKMNDGYSRYWSIERQGTTVTIESGRIGGEGGGTREKQTLSFDNEESARDEHDKLVAERVARVGAPIVDVKEGWGHQELIIEEPADPTREWVFIRRWFDQGHHERFWTLIQDGPTLSFTWGDPTTYPDGIETETLTFADEEEARRERDKRIARKITEGYAEQVEVQAVPGTSPFGPPNHLCRRLVKGDGPPRDVYVREGNLFSHDPQGRPPIRWRGPYPHQTQAFDPLERLVEEMKADGYREVEPEAVRPSPMQAMLEAAVEAEPDNLAPRMAYADWLMEQPDPALRARGEFIQVQLALVDESLPADERASLRKREADLLEGHNAAWCGPFAAYDGGVGFAFDRGWVRSVSFSRFDTPEELERTLRAFVAWPLARFLRELELNGRDADEALPLLVSAPFVQQLRRFTLGEPEQGGGGPLAPLLRGAVRLEELEVYGTRLDMRDFFALPLPHLRELTVHGCEVPYPLEVLAANPALPRLEAVRFWPHHLRHGDDPYISAESACALFRTPHLPALKRVAIYQSELGDEGCRALVESGILGRLEELDLDMGRITDEGARILAGCPDLPRLRRLVLTQNQLTEAGIELLRSTGVPLKADGQFSAEAIANSAHLEGGDFE